MRNTRTCMSGCMPMPQRSPLLPLTHSKTGRTLLIASAVVILAAQVFQLMVTRNSVDVFKEYFDNLSSELQSFMKQTKDGNDDDDRKLHEQLCLMRELMKQQNVAIQRLRTEMRNVVEIMRLQTQHLSDTSRQEIEKMIKTKLEMYSSDKTGLTDYASEIIGGKILTTRDTETFGGESRGLSILGLPLCVEPSKAKSIIQSSVMPGECWAITGHTGNAVIQLIAKIIITSISLEHIPKAISPTGEIDSAPREFSVWGLTCPDHTNDAHFFGRFFYNNSGPPLQTFEVEKPSMRAYNIVEFKLHSNHGHPDYTCIYRLRVHGKLENGYSIGRSI